jgi:hypothetical protein
VFTNLSGDGNDLKKERGLERGDVSLDGRSASALIGLPFSYILFYCISYVTLLMVVKIT